MTIATAPVKTLTFTRTITAPVAQVYQSFTNRDDLCDWLSHDADVRAQVGGYLFLMWNDGNHAYGTFSEVDENKKLVLNWQASHHPDPTTVEIVFKETGGQTTVELTHNDVHEEVAERYKKDWNIGLNALKALLETGENLNITERVLVGIYAGPFNEAIAQEMGVPAKTGTLVAGVIPELSAGAAGIQANDVLVEIDDQALTDDYYIGRALEGKKPGDVVQVGFYRGAEKHTVNVELKGYPLPFFPADYKGLADALEKSYAALHQRMEALLKGASEAVLEAPVPNTEYNVIETVASIILGERATHAWLGSYTHPEGPRRTYMRPSPEKIKAILAVHPTVGDLLAELKRVRAEMVAMLRAFPDTLRARKNYLWWITFEIDPEQRFAHLTLDQIKNAVDAAK